MAIMMMGLTGGVAGGAGQWCCDVLVCHGQGETSGGDTEVTPTYIYSSPCTYRNSTQQYWSFGFNQSFGGIIYFGWSKESYFMKSVLL